MFFSCTWEIIERFDLELLRWIFSGTKIFLFPFFSSSNRWISKLLDNLLAEEHVRPSRGAINFARVSIEMKRERERGEKKEERKKRREKKRKEFTTSSTNLTFRTFEGKNSPHHRFANDTIELLNSVRKWKRSSPRLLLSSTFLWLSV